MTRSTDGWTLTTTTLRTDATKDTSWMATSGDTAATGNGADILLSAFQVKIKCRSSLRATI